MGLSIPVSIIIHATNRNENVHLIDSHVPKPTYVCSMVLDHCTLLLLEPGHVIDIDRVFYECTGTSTRASCHVPYNGKIWR